MWGWNADAEMVEVVGRPLRTVCELRARLWTWTPSDEVDARRLESLESERDVIGDLWDAILDVDSGFQV